MLAVNAVNGRLLPPADHGDTSSGQKWGYSQLSLYSTTHIVTRTGDPPPPIWGTRVILVVIPYRWPSTINTTQWITVNLYQKLLIIITRDLRFLISDSASNQVIQQAHWDEIQQGPCSPWSNGGTTDMSEAVHRWLMVYTGLYHGLAVFEKRRELGILLKPAIGKVFDTARLIHVSASGFMVFSGSRSL